MKKCEIIMVRYGLPELEKECIDSVIAHTEDVDYHLTDYDNYEKDEGLSKVWNDLIRESDAEYICLLNNDTRVENEWLSKMIECFEENETLGALGPMTNSSTGPQGSGKYRTDKKRLLKARYPLVGFCLVFPKKVWEEVGGFDEGYEIYGEDSDFIMEVKEHGYIVMIRTDVFIFHHGKASQPIAEARGKDILKLKATSKARFIKKWKSGPLTEVQKAELEEKAEELRKEAQKKKAARAAAREAKRQLFKDPVQRTAYIEKLDRHERFLKWKAGKSKKDD